MKDGRIELKRKEEKRFTWIEYEKGTYYEMAGAELQGQNKA